MPNTYATELSLEQRTILLKLHGAVDPLPEREWESFVVTEDDYIDYLGRSELDRGRAGRARREAAAQPLPLPRLRDGRLEPALDPPPHLGRPPVAYRSWAVQRAPSRSRGVLAARRRRPLDVDPSSVRRAARAAAGGGVSSAPTSPVQGARAVRGLRARRAPLLRPRARDRDRRCEPLASRLTVLYGPSGVGKSRSCAPASRARCARCRRSRSWSSSRAGATIRRRARRGGRRGAGLSTNGSVVDALERRKPTREVYLVLDQAEEYFLYHADDGGPGRSPRRCPRCSPRLARQRSRLPARGHARAARSLQGADPEPVRELAASRPPRPRGGARAIVGPVERYAELRARRCRVEPELVERFSTRSAPGRSSRPRRLGARRGRRRRRGSRRRTSSS